MFFTVDGDWEEAHKRMAEEHELAGSNGHGDLRKHSPSPEVCIIFAQLNVSNGISLLELLFSHTGSVFVRLN